MEADFDTFFARLRALYAHLPYGSTEAKVPEAAYQRILYVLLAAGSTFRVTAEDRQAQGRADLVAESDERVYIFELKIKGTAAEALAQIKDRGYAEPYRATGKPIPSPTPSSRTLADPHRAGLRERRRETNRVPRRLFWRPLPVAQRPRTARSS